MSHEIVLFTFKSLHDLHCLFENCGGQSVNHS
jgi:hypothetical protein